MTWPLQTGLVLFCLMLVTRGEWVLWAHRRDQHLRTLSSFATYCLLPLSIFSKTVNSWQITILWQGRLYCFLQEPMLCSSSARHPRPISVCLDLARWSRPKCTVVPDHPFGRVDHSAVFSVSAPRLPRPWERPSTRSPIAAIIVSLMESAGHNYLFHCPQAWRRLQINKLCYREYSPSCWRKFTRGMIQRVLSHILPKMQGCFGATYG